MKPLHTHSLDHITWYRGQECCCWQRLKINIAQETNPLKNTQLPLAL